MFLSKLLLWCYCADSTFATCDPCDIIFNETFHSFQTFLQSSSNALHESFPSILSIHAARVLRWQIKHRRLKARVSQTHMCASFSARNEKHGTRKKTGGEKKTSNSTVTFDFWSALLFAGPEGKPLENFSSWESRSNIHRASGGSLFNPLFHFRDCCFK